MHGREKVQETVGEGVLGASRIRPLPDLAEESGEIECFAHQVIVCAAVRDVKRGYIRLGWPGLFPVFLA